MTFEEFIKLREFIYKKTGIYFEDQKMYYVKNRVLNQIELTGHEDFKSYFSWLKFDNTGRGLQELVNILTVNETYFFREYYQLKCFAEEILPEIVERKKKENDKEIKIWSAGCSTGEEPYTLAIILEEVLEYIHGIKWEIYATDLNTDVLKKAERGLYLERSLRVVPEEYKKRYFYHNDQYYEVIPKLKKNIAFFQLNLIDKTEMQKMRNFDVIFCRNVLIYFDDISRRQVANYFYEALLDGGYIFLGHSESMSRITPIFKLRKYKNAYIYTK
ncbi:MCP methyltransferase, CheR-type [Thermoanaerobacterium xylanolyticum LX-11]|uniref:protein-glutamate O-methyltransferase n=1 Tax=Thermoanaerobacterium xylanolyticum (strain ATCC 49914 / DSM 7097 / LX-11) TaxID=858215 RepID=F6BLC7_THEXL|nr:protein-glutamate O-methyltransferase CheR [Thermoanaerobacterium xylanolyticum]AEF16103.1 MCP methyltransferase, CheR-type [Thermoanaerobacterium xylanolyticum LX-11]